MDICFIDFHHHFYLKKLNKNYIPKKDCAHPLEHINIINKKSFIQMCEILELNLCNLMKFKKSGFNF